MVTDQDYWDEQQNLIESQAAEIAALQANLDRLMLEYCPDEMTDAQLEKWAKNQKPYGLRFVPDEESIMYRKLCDQLGRALDGHCAPFLGHEEEHRLALEKWRATK